MRAVVVERFMEPAELGVRETPAPPLLPGCLRVEVRAAGCNFFDILMVQGRYQVKPPFPFIPGAEIAGVVREVGAITPSLPKLPRVPGLPVSPTFPRLPSWPPNWDD